MSTATALVEQSRIDLWRFERLRAAGFPTATAMTLATRQDVDLHRSRPAGRGLPARHRREHPVVRNP